LLERYQKEAAILVMIKKIDDTGNTHELTIKDFTRSGLNRSIDVITLDAHNQKLDAVFVAAKKKAFEFMQGHLAEGDVSVVQVGPASVSSDDEDQGAVSHESGNQSGNDAGDEEDGDDSYRPAPSGMGPTGDSRGIPVKVAYNSLREWQDVRRKLSAQPWIQSYDVVSFNKDQAQIMIESTLPSHEVEAKLSALGVSTSGASGAGYRPARGEDLATAGTGDVRPTKLAPLSIRQSEPRQD